MTVSFPNQRAGLGHRAGAFLQPSMNGESVGQLDSRKRLFGRHLDIGGDESIESG